MERVNLTKIYLATSVARVAKCLPSKHEALSSNLKNFCKCHNVPPVQ
jgi:hypothetical protein